MRYATPAEMIAAAPANLVAHLTGTTAPDETALGRALDAASAKIDGYLAARYILPLVDVPELLKGLAIDIAFYGLQQLRPLGDIEDSRARYKDAIDMLKDIAAGKINLGLPAGGDAGSAPAVSSGAAFSAPPSIMTNLGY